MPFVRRKDYREKLTSTLRGSTTIMGSIEDYRETPRTGRTPIYSEHESDPDPSDPSVLTDDRADADLLVFEKTWGHRMLAGLGVAMIVIALVLVVFCIIQLAKVASIASAAPDIGLLGTYLYGTGLVSGIVIIVPAVVAIYVAKRPKKVLVAIVMAIVGIVVALAFFVYAISTSPQMAGAAVLYTLLLALFPVLYLIAALKIKRSSRD